MINTIKALGHSQKLWQQAISSQINQSNNVDEEKYQFLFSE